MTRVQSKNRVKHSRNVMYAVVVSALFAAPTLQAAASDSTSAQPEQPKVVIETSEGTIELSLRPDVAPKTVANFLAYAKRGFYEGTIFHRVIPGFMIQGGGFDKTLQRRQTEAPVPIEASPTVKNLRGTVAMARTNDPDSATSQFFINLVDNDFLNAGVRGAGYTVFGRVTSGMGVVDAIASQPTERQHGMADVPKAPVVIQSVHRMDE